MTRHELPQPEVSRGNDNLLDSSIATTVASNSDSVTAKFQREAELLRDGLSSGFMNRLEHAKEHAVATTLEVAGSFGVGAGLAAMAKAGGRWGTAAKVAGAGFTLMMAGDVSRRAIPTMGAMADAWHSDLNMAHNKDVVGHYAGAALFDYPVMLASGVAGAGAVHFSPKMTEFLRTKEPTLSSPLGYEMNLGQSARLGAKERGGGVSDAVADIRTALELPNKKGFALNELPQVMEAKRLAVHPDVAPTRGAMLETIAKIDAIKPEVATNRSALQAAEKQLGEVTGLKAERKAVEQGERVLQALEQDGIRHTELKTRETELAQSLKEKGEKAPADPEAVRTELGEVRAEMKTLEQRLATQDAAENNLTAADRALAERELAIAEGRDPQANALNERVNALRESLQQAEARLAEHTAELGRLNVEFKAKQDAVRPNLDASVMPGEVPGLIKAPKLEVKPAAAGNRQQPVRQADAAIPSLTIEGGGKGSGSAPSLQGAVPEVVSSSVLKAAAESTASENNLGNLLGEASGVKPEVHALDAMRIQLGKQVEAAVAPRVTDANAKLIAAADALAPKRADARPVGESQGHRVPENRGAETGDRRSAQGDRQQGPRDRSQRPTETQVIGEAEVAKALTDARRAVDDFAATGKRHTTALKGVTEYIDAAFQWFGNDAAALGRSNEILGNVNAMLGKVKNWERGASWIPKQGAERASLMSRNGMDATQMAKYDQWYETVRGNYQPKGNSQTESVLSDIQAHLQQRVMVESVKWYLKQAPDAAAAVSPIVQKGFQMVRDGYYPNGRPIHEGADLIVFERRTVQGPDGPMEVILPFAKDGKHIQRFDADAISNGMGKQEVMANEGPAGIRPEDLYGFRLDHDPIRLAGSAEQVGYAILRPGGHGKNVAHLEFAPGVEVPQGLRADSATHSGTNTGTIYNALRQLGGQGQRQGGGGGNRH
ncbi:MAG: hypothetical protein K2W95_20205 [Candidatus Obscuribacterales bacterium]|nr:hypothetical protein [Candidatus Obscuribacterales bacterium]